MCPKSQVLGQKFPALAQHISHFLQGCEQTEQPPQDTSGVKRKSSRETDRGEDPGERRTLKIAFSLEWAESKVPGAAQQGDLS